MAVDMGGKAAAGRMQRSHGVQELLSSLDRLSISVTFTDGPSTGEMGRGFTLGIHYLIILETRMDGWMGQESQIS